MLVKGGISVNSVYLTSRSITYAQRMEKVLIKNGISAHIERPELEITERGCAYAVVVSEGFFAEAIDVLRYNGILPVKAVVRDRYNGYKVIDI